MSTSLLRRLGLTGALALLASPMAALATPYPWPAAPLAPPPGRTAYGPGYGGAYPPPLLRQPLPPARQLSRGPVDPYAYGDRYGNGDRYADGDRYGNGDRTAYGNRYGSPAAPSDPALLEAQLAQRCNIGRLVGGLMGGGIGYAASRQDGRTWAVPLGALLGQQMGCSVGAGRTPLPW